MPRLMRKRNNQIPMSTKRRPVPYSKVENIGAFIKSGKR